MSNKWLPEEDDLLRAKYGRIKIEEIVVLLPRHPLGSIHKRAQKLRLKANDRVTYRKYRVDFDYFSRMTLRACYWAGFIAADGCIGKDHSLHIALAAKDRDQIERFVRDVGFNGPIDDYLTGQKDGSTKPTARVVCWGVHEWVRDLREIFNITPRKSLTLRPPLGLTDEQSLAFIIGYVDGDGSIRWHRRSCPSKDGTYKQQFHFDVVGTMEVLEWIMSKLRQLDQRADNRRIYIVNHHPALRYSGVMAEEMCRRLLEIDCGPRLSRKWGNVPPGDCLDSGPTSPDPSMPVPMEVRNGDAI